MNRQYCLLDEPYAGLDVRWAEELTELLAELAGGGNGHCARGRHEWRTAWPVADEVAVIVRGRLALGRNAAENMTADGLRDEYGGLGCPRAGAEGAWVG